jgi:hypothetical protein
LGTHLAFLPVMPLALVTALLFVALAILDSISNAVKVPSSSGIAKNQPPY